jgi:hypothetical protein
MLTARSCVVRAFHRQGRPIDLAPFGRGRRRQGDAARCGDCGVARGGWHHPGCDLQRCPVCRGQLLTCGCRFDEDWTDDLDVDDLDDDEAEPLGVDGNGCLTERRCVGGVEVVIHRDNVPESDVTTVRGIRCTTPVRTLIDLAPEIDAFELRQMVTDFLQRGLFTIAEAEERLRQPDMTNRRGALLLGQMLATLASG